MYVSDVRSPPLNWFSGSWVELHFGGTASQSTSHHGSQEQIPTSAQEGDVEKMLLEAQRESGRTSSRGSTQCNRSAGEGEAQPGFVEFSRRLQQSGVFPCFPTALWEHRHPSSCGEARTQTALRYRSLQQDCICFCLRFCCLPHWLWRHLFLVRWRFPRAEIRSREPDEKERWLDLGLVQPPREQPTKVWNVHHFEMIFFNLCF